MYVVGSVVVSPDGTRLGKGKYTSPKKYSYNLKKMRELIKMNMYVYAKNSI